MLEHLAAVREVAGSNPTQTKTGKTLTVHPAVKWYLAIVGEGSGGERRDWAQPFTCHSPRHDGALTPHCPYGH